MLTQSVRERSVGEGKPAPRHVTAVTAAELGFNLFNPAAKKPQTDDAEDEGPPAFTAAHLRAEAAGIPMPICAGRITQLSVDPFPRAC